MPRKLSATDRLSPIGLHSTCKVGLSGGVVDWCGVVVRWVVVV